MTQKKYNEIKSKPSRYKIGQSGKSNSGEVENYIYCNTVEDKSIPGEPLNNTNEVISNWSVAEEIKRLISINSVTPIEKEYAFLRKNDRLKYSYAPQPPTPFDIQDESGYGEDLKLFNHRIELMKWGKNHGYKDMSITDIAKMKLELDLISHEFYGYKNINEVDYPTRWKNPIKSPLADKDEGYRLINCITDIRHIGLDDLAELLIQVNSRTINNYKTKW